MTSAKQQVKFLLSATLVTLLLGLCLAPTESQGLWLLPEFLTNSKVNQTSLGGLLGSALEGSGDQVKSSGQQRQQQQQQQQQVLLQAVQQQEQKLAPAQQQTQDFTIAGLRPAGIASLLNTVSETGFTYFNVQNQCRSRTACDMGFMLYKKLNFVHNWIIRASVRTLVDSQNVYAQSWNTGMMGRNCTLSYPACNQSPLDSLMSVAALSGLF